MIWKNWMVGQKRLNLCKKLIGKSLGCEINFEMDSSNEKINILLQDLIQFLEQAS